MSSVQDFPEYAYFLIADTTSMELGSYTMASTGDLSTVHMTVYHRYSGAYSYTLSVVLSSSEDGPALATSTAETFSNATTGQATNDWLGNLTFVFPTEYNLLSGETYFFRMTLTGYVRDAEADYFGVWCDWTEPLGTTNTAGARLAIGIKQ